MFDRFDDRTLEIATVVVVVIIALVILCYLAIYINPQVFFNPFKPPSPTPEQVAQATTIVGPTWTPTPTSTATNTPSHIPKSGPFQKPPGNKATIMLGSSSVFINGKPAARNGDTALTCNDPADLPAGTVVAVSTVNIG